jgi:hypothetical protein
MIYAWILIQVNPTNLFEDEKIENFFPYFLVKCNSFPIRFSCDPGIYCVNNSLWWLVFLLIKSQNQISNRA